VLVGFVVVVEAADRLADDAARCAARSVRCMAVVGPGPLSNAARGGAGTGQDCREG